MTGRRSHPRFVVAAQWNGALRVLHDVVVDRVGGSRLLIECRTPGVRDELLTLELIGAARSLSLSVRVLDSRPVIVSGALRHRVELGFSPGPSRPWPRQDDGLQRGCEGDREQHTRSGWMDELDAILAAPDRAAVLGRVVQVRVVDISVSGCLLESARRLDKDSAGVLRIVMDGEHYTDDIRVVRAEPARTSGLHQFGGQFLWTSSPGERSLRRIVARLQGAPYRAPDRPPAGTGLASGSPGTVLPSSKSDA